MTANTLSNKDLRHKGPPEDLVLMLPGMSLNATIFPDLDLPVVAADFTRLVVSPDGTPTPAGPPMGLYATRLDALLDGAGWATARRRWVVAHSFGGMLWLWRSLQAGGRSTPVPDGTVLISTSAGPLFAAAALRLPGLPWRLPLAPLMRWWNRPGVTRACKRLLSRGRLRATPVDFRRLRRRSDAAVDRAGWRNTDWRAMRTFRCALDGYDVREGLSAIGGPTIVLHGTRDSLLPPTLGRELARGLPEATFRLIDGAGHALPLTHPDAVRHALDDLRGRGAGR